MKVKCRFCLVLLFSILSGVIKAESKFTAKISFPLSINLKKVTIEYHNGLHQLAYKIDTSNYTQEITAVYYSKYPVLIVSYNPEDNLLTYPQKYFLENNSSLRFKETPKKGLRAEDLKGAYASKDMGEEKFNLFAKKQLKALNTFLSANVQYLNDSSAIFDKFIRLDADVQKKKLLFIQSRSDLYYSLWLFKEEFVSNRTYNTDSLQQVYNRFFSKKFSDTWEGNLIAIILNGRLNSFKGKTAPSFVSQDFKENIVDLAQFRDKKYVILNFWASWCKPCLAEMPMLDSIYQLYSNKDVVIISVSGDRIKEKSLKNIDRLRMNWVNIINDPMVESAYGNPTSLPQVYLINKEGKIIYSRTDDQDYDLKKLFNLMKEL